MNADFDKSKSASEMEKNAAKLCKGYLGLFYITIVETSHVNTANYSFASLQEISFFFIKKEDQTKD